MHDFLVAEWKTLLAVLLFCGCIFAWFYADEVKKAQNDNSQYQMTCIRPGESILDYKLGTPISQIDLTDFIPSSNANLHVTQYRKNNDSSVTLSFRDDKLITVEVDLQNPDFSDTCREDLKFFKKKQSPVAQSIPVGDTTDNIYEGLVLVTKTTPSDDDDPTKAAKKSDASIIIVPI